MPWTGLMYNFDGTVKNCIRSVESLPIGNVREKHIADIVVDEENIKRQTQIANREPVASCQTCYDLERDKTGFDIISDRIFYIRELKQVPAETYTPGNFDLRTTDVRWSNLCNFACVYCSPQFSSRWASELDVALPTPSNTQRDNLKQYILDHASGLDHVYLAGGEPLLMKENLELLCKLKKTTKLRINTNLSKVDTRVFEAICEFKNVHWTISLETTNEEFEYIRFGGKWLDLVENLSIIKQLNHKITFNMLHFALNYMSIFDTVSYLQNLGFHNNSFVIGGLSTPTWLDVRNLPNYTLDKITDKLHNELNRNPGFLLEDSYGNMLHYVNQPFTKNLDLTLRKLSELDQRRNLNSMAIFEKFYKEINHGKTI